MSRPSGTEIRRHAHRLAAEGLSAALNTWELDQYYADVDDRDRLEHALLRIIDRHRQQGGEPASAAETNGWSGDEHAEPGTRGWTA